MMQNLWLMIRDATVVVVNMLFSIYRSLRENSGLAVLSVVLAFGVWIIVTDAENPETTQVLNNVDIPVEPVNVEGDVAVESIDPATVRVRVRVEEDVLETLTAADFNAVLDLQGFTVGEYTRPVAVEALVGRGGLRIEEVIPPEVDVVIVDLDERQVPVVVDIAGEPPPGFRMAQPEPEVTQVTVAGPQSRTVDVTQATATIDVTSRTDTITQAVRLEPRDARGNLVTGVSVDPALVEVVVEIDQQTFSRPLVVAPDIVGQPAPGYTIESVNVEPRTVTVTGPEEYIESTDLITTESIDISGENSDFVRTVSLVAPIDVDVIPEGTQVTVSIRIRPVDGSISMSVPLQAENVGADLSVVGGLPTIEVVLTGPQPQLLELAVSDVAATVDMSGNGEGTHEADVEIDTPNGIDVESVSPSRVSVTIAGP